jgi:hypothetical protein
MKAGDKVRVYYDPLTQEEFEGDAKLKKFEMHVGVYEGQNLSRWRVRFSGDTKDVTRNILEPAGLESF